MLEITRYLSKYILNAHTRQCRELKILAVCELVSVHS